MITYTIPLPPVTKKNSIQMALNRKTGKYFPLSSKEYREYEKKAAWYLRPKPEKAIDYPVNIQGVFYTKTMRTVDLTNLLEALDDLLVDAGIIRDDNRAIVVSHDGSRVFWDKKNPRTEIIIDGPGAWA